MLDAHRLSMASLTATAEGSSDPALVARLELAYRSRQLTLLRAVLDRTERLGVDLSPLSPLGDAWTVLAEAQRLDASAVDMVITLPRTGVWTADVQRALDDARECPLWTILGYFHQMAAAAMIRAGGDFVISVPAWRGHVLLPSLGVVVLPSDEEWSVVEIRRVDTRVFVSYSAVDIELSDDEPDWLPLRAVPFGERSLWLDDVDPHRQYGAPIAPQRLSDDELAQWTEILADTWKLLATHHADVAAELSAGLTALVPYPVDDRADSVYSASHNDAFGSVLLSRPPDAATLAEILIHEFQHSKFGVLLSLIDLLEPDGDNETPWLYAPWRDDPRPSIGVLHGAYSFLAVAAFYRRHIATVDEKSRTSVQFEFAYHRGRTYQGVESLLNGAELSEFGREFLNTMRNQLECWALEPLPGAVRQAANRVRTDHWLIWRMRHLRPADVTAVVTAWLAGDEKAPPVEEPQLVPVVGDVPNPRLVLTRMCMAEPERVGLQRESGASAADVALVCGDTEQATRLYRQQVMVQPELVGAWAGLALASDEKALLTRPELVVQVYREIRARSESPVDPVRLARWLG